MLSSNYTRLVYEIWGPGHYEPVYVSGGADSNNCGGSSGSSGTHHSTGQYTPPVTHVNNSNNSTAVNTNNTNSQSLARTLANLQTISLQVNTLPKLSLPTLPTFGGTGKGAF